MLPVQETHCYLFKFDNLLYSYEFVDQNENMTKIPVITLFLPTYPHILEMSRKI